MSGKTPPHRTLFNWCENCARRADNGDHVGHVLISWTTKDQQTVMSFTREG